MDAETVIKIQKFLSIINCLNDLVPVINVEAMISKNSK